MENAPKRSLSTPGGGLLVTGTRKGSNNAFELPVKRTESLVSRASSRIVSALGKPAEDHKYARTTMQSYFPRDPPNFGDMSLEVKNIVIKALKTNLGQAAIPRWNKLRGTLRVGVGRVHILLKKKKKNINHWLFDVGLIKDISLKTEHSKDVTLSFHNRAILLRLVFDSYKTCINVVENILYEAQFLANCFNKILKKNCNPAWLKVLKLDKFYESNDVNNIEEAELTDEEVTDLLVEDSELHLLEKCLREEVDLNVLGRGEEHPESCDAMERLGLFLKRNIRSNEAKVWLDKAVAGRKKYMQMTRGEAMIEEDQEGEEMKKKEAKAIEKVRFNLKKNLANLNYEVRLEMIEKKLALVGNQAAQEKKEDEKDEFEDLL